MPDETLADLYDSVFGSSPAVTYARNAAPRRPLSRQMRPPQLRGQDPRLAPSERARAYNEIQRAQLPLRGERAPPSNQFAEAGVAALESTGLPSIQRSGNAMREGDYREMAIEGGSGLLGLAGLVGGLRTARPSAPMPPRPALPRREARVATPREEHIARYWNEDWRSADEFSAGDPARGSANENQFRVIENPPSPALDASNRQGPLIPHRVSKLGRDIYEPSSGVEMEIAPGGLTLFTYRGRARPGGGTAGEAQRVFRGAYRALLQDIKAKQRPLYRWRPETPRQAEFYREAMRTRAPEGYVFTEDGNSMLLERSPSPQGDMPKRRPLPKRNPTAPKGAFIFGAP